MAKLITVTLKRICSNGFFASGKFVQYAHPLMDYKQAKATMLHHYTSILTHSIEVSDKLFKGLATRNKDSDWEEFAALIKKFLQCSPNEERLISYGQFPEMRIVKVSGREVYMMPPLMLPERNSGNFHIESIDWAD